MRYAIGLLVLGLAACGTPRESPSVPRLATPDQPSRPPPQVLLSPTDRPPEESEPGAPMQPITEAERQRILSRQAPVFEPYSPPPEPVIVERSVSVWDHIRDFPLFHTLAYAGLGAIIGNQFDNNSGAGAAIGAGLGFLHDELEGDAERARR